MTTLRFTHADVKQDFIIDTENLGNGIWTDVLDDENTPCRVITLKDSVNQKNSGLYKSSQNKYYQYNNNTLQWENTQITDLPKTLQNKQIWQQSKNTSQLLETLNLKNKIPLWEVAAEELQKQSRSSRPAHKYPQHSKLEINADLPKIRRDLKETKQQLKNAFTIQQMFVDHVQETQYKNDIDDLLEEVQEVEQNISKNAQPPALGITIITAGPDPEKAEGYCKKIGRGFLVLPASIVGGVIGLVEGTLRGTLGDILFGDVSLKTPLSPITTGYTRGKDAASWIWTAETKATYEQEQKLFPLQLGGRQYIPTAEGKVALFYVRNAPSKGLDEALEAGFTRSETMVATGTTADLAKASTVVQLAANYLANNPLPQDGSPQPYYYISGIGRGPEELAKALVLLGVEQSHIVYVDWAQKMKAKQIVIHDKDDEKLIQEVNKVKNFLTDVPAAIATEHHDDEKKPFLIPNVQPIKKHGGTSPG